MNWLQENTETLNSWYNNRISSDDVVKRFRKEKAEFKYYLIGNDAIAEYNDFYQDEEGEEVTGVDALIEAYENNQCFYDTFKEEVGVTTITEFGLALYGRDWLLISEEEYNKLNWFSCKTETPEPKLFKISGYWKDDGKEFSDYIVSAYDGFSDDENIEIDDEIFFYGMSEEEIKEAIVHGQETGEDFVITSYKIYR
ncbi:MAG: hypothetical protein WAT79_08460 [Saprospiraceae bacterium]